MADDPKENLMSIDPEKAYHLQRTQVLQDLQDSMLAWGKRRFWLIAIIISIIGIFGGNLLIKSTVREIMEKEIEKLTSEAKKASLSAAIADVSAKKARDATDSASKKSEEYSKAVDALTEKAKATDNDFETLRLKLKSESERIIALTKLDSDEYISRLQELEGVVKKLASTFEKGQPLIESYEKTLSNTKKAAQTSRNLFQERSSYKIFYWAFGKIDYVATSEFADKASREGYKVDIWPKQFPQPPYERKETDVTIQYTSIAKEFLSNIKEIISSNSLVYDNRPISFKEQIIKESDPKYLDGKVIYIQFHLK